MDSTKNFLDYEQCQKLHKIGFKEKVDYHYTELDKERPYNAYRPNHLEYHEQRFPAPTVHEFLKWIYDNYVIFISVFVDDNTRECFRYEIYQMNPEYVENKYEDDFMECVVPAWTTGQWFRNPDEALNQGINVVLDHLTGEKDFAVWKEVDFENDDN